MTTCWSVVCHAVITLDTVYLIRLSISVACFSNDVWDDLEREKARCVSDYFPIRRSNVIAEWFLSTDRSCFLLARIGRTVRQMFPSPSTKMINDLISLVKRLHQRILLLRNHFRWNLLFIDREVDHETTCSFVIQRLLFAVISFYSCTHHHHRRCRREEKRFFFLIDR